MKIKVNNPLSIFRNADGSTNVGYVCLFWVVQAIIGVIVGMMIAAFIQQYYSPTHEFPFSAFSIAVGLVVTAMLPLLGGIAAFLWADSKNPQVGTVTTTSSSQDKQTTEVKQGAA